MRVLVTGIGGSIGIWMFRYLMQNTDWDIVGIDSFRHKGLTDRLEYTLERRPNWRQRLTLITHDLAAPISFMASKRSQYVDGIINFASVTDVTDSIVEPGIAFHNNHLLMLNMLEMARNRHCLKFFVHVSSDEVYGPVAAEAERHGEWAPIIPSSPYAASKACQEAMAISYWRTYKLPLIIVNIANNFGPMQSAAKFPCIAIKNIMEGKPVPIHVHKQIGKEHYEGTRYYLHSYNTADAIHFLIQQPLVLHEDGRADKPDRYNISDVYKLTNSQLAFILAKYLKTEWKPEYLDVHKERPGHDLHYGLDNKKIHDMGWEPPMAFHDSLQATVEWYKRNPAWLNLSQK